ncbi:hypothetical protein IAE35_21765 [Pseudomonas sp. S75]|uniref:DUF6543 domain-containing protein n=1 Tax=unclassified Pseudomonas TaxID=196821 RepID=UPI0019050492|nr:MULTISPECIES: DUF6543 domain-containing protein [unclassified Pseudomonas]MBJ9978145.1 hypothetical protein [Pseudomonas sp. S30]MBK0155976.1 hypothetical protein [Pseudomonas sp. S75]
MIDLFGFDLSSDPKNPGRGVNPDASQADQLQALADCVVYLRQCLMAAPALDASLQPLADEPWDAFRLRLQPALDEVSARREQWWSIQSVLRLDGTLLSSHLMRLMDLEGLTFLNAHHEQRSAIRDLLLTRGETGQPHEVCLVVGDERIRLPGTYASLPDQDEDEAQERPRTGDVLVHCVTTGIWFDREPRRVAKALRARLRQDCIWATLLSEAQRLSLEQDVECDLAFVPLERSMFKGLLKDLQQLQEVLMAHAMQDGDDPVKIVTTLQAAAHLEPFVYQAERYSARSSAAYLDSLLPAWRRFLTGDELQGYQALEAQVQKATKHSEDLLGHLSSLEDYAKHAISNYLKDRLDLALDPNEVTVRIEHRFALDVSKPEPSDATLLRWALRGGYRGQRLAVKVLGTSLAAEAVQDMIDALDLRRSYIEAVTQRYQRDDMRQGVVDCIAARLALSVRAARHQGAAKAACELVEAAMADQMQARGIKAGLIGLGQERAVLKHLLYLSDASIHLLYAPGAPDGDFLVYPSTIAMNEAIIGWAADEQGVEFLVEQSALADREGVQRQLEQARRLPDRWSPDDLRVQWIESQAWSDVLHALGARRCSAMRDDLLASTPQWYIDAPAQLRQALGDVDQELEQVSALYSVAAPLMGLDDYARQQVADYINAVPGNRGGPIDPDKVMVDISDSERRTLTQAVIEGYAASFNFAQFARIDSVDGQDVSHLSREVLASYIRSARLGERYIERLQSTFLDPSFPGHAAQRELHRLLISLKMRRDLLSQLMQGQVPKRVAAWMLAGVESLAGPNVLEDFAVVDLRVDGVRIEGAYRLYRRSRPQAGEAIYLPDVPRGPAYRSRAQVADSWGDDGLGDYFYRRASWNNQPRLGSLHKRIVDAGEGGAALAMAALQPYKDQPLTDLADDLPPRVQRLIADADRQAVSVAERVSSVVVEWVIVVASLLTIPIPPANMLIGIGCAVRSFVNAGQAWRDGDRTSAMTQFATGALGVFASSGALGRVLSKALQSARQLLGVRQAVQAVAMEKMTVAKWMKQLADEIGFDAASEMFPALYEGFDTQLLRLIEHRTWR